MSEENSEGKIFRGASMLRRVSANDVSALLKEAFEKFVAGQYPAAQQLCTQALEQDPQNFEVHQLMAMACFHAGDRTTAITYFETCVTLQPDKSASPLFSRQWLG